MSINTRRDKQPAGDTSRGMGMTVLASFLDIVQNPDKYEKLIKGDREAAKKLETERLKISKAKDIDNLHKRAVELQDQASRELQRAVEKAEKLIEDARAEVAKGLEALSEEQETFLEYKNVETDRLRNWVARQDERAEIIATREKETAANLKTSQEAAEAGKQFRQRWQDKWKRLEAVK